MPLSISYNMMQPFGDVPKQLFYPNIKVTSDFIYHHTERNFKGQ